MFCRRRHVFSTFPWGALRPIDFGYSLPAVSGASRADIHRTYLGASNGVEKPGIEEYRRNREKRWTLVFWSSFRPATKSDRGGYTKVLLHGLQTAVLTTIEREMLLTRAR